MEKKIKKTYAIGVKAENYGTGNHSIAGNDWRWRAKDKYISFTMSDGSVAKVDKKGLSAFLYQDKKGRSRYIPVDTVDKETGEAVRKWKFIWLVPNSYIITHNVA